ncbi:MAG: iron-sulfur cluster assembly protein, partial [Pirellulales bacterium]
MSRTPVDRAAVEAVLRDFQDPETGRGLLDMEQVRDLSVDDTRIALQLGLTSYVRPLWNETKADLIERLKNETGAEQVEIELFEFDRKPQQIGQIGLTAKSVIAVASG